MTRSHRAPSRKDRNHDQIARALRRFGEVEDCHADPASGCDLRFDRAGHTWRVEIKDGSKPPSARRLTDNERAMMDACRRARTRYVIARDVIEALCALGISQCSALVGVQACGCGSERGPERFRGRNTD